MVISLLIITRLPRCHELLIFAAELLYWGVTRLIFIFVYYFRYVYLSFLR